MDEQTRILLQKFIDKIWPEYSSQLYSDLYRTYHPSTYVEGFTNPKGNFEFGYFDRSYEVERATFQSINGNQGKIVTKSRKLGTYGKQNGFYSSLNLNLGSLFDARLAFQNLNGQ